jgi:hypothetical protein
MNRQLRSLTSTLAVCAAFSSVSAQANSENAAASPFPGSAVGTYRGVSFEERSYVAARWSGVHGRYEERVPDAPAVYASPCHGGNTRGAEQLGFFALGTLLNPVGWLIAPIVVPIAVVAAVATSIDNERCRRTR